MSSWSGQLCGKEGYFLQFETKDYDTYRRVEKLCQDIMDEERAKRETEKKSILNYEIDEIVGIDYTMIPDSCKNCSNHPSNGGSGICNCTLGQHSINAIPTASETICESKTIATNKITEHELKVFNLYDEVKQSLKDAIKFESKETNNK